MTHSTIWHEFNEGRVPWEVKECAGCGYEFEPWADEEECAECRERALEEEDE
jgi:hypothetical protein